MTLPKLTGIQEITVFRNFWFCCLFFTEKNPDLTTLVLLEFLRWLCNSLVAPSWNVFGKAPSNMVNSGVFSSNREIRTICAAQKIKRRRKSELQHFIKKVLSVTGTYHNIQIAVKYIHYICNITHSKYTTGKYCADQSITVKKKKNQSKRLLTSNEMPLVSFFVNCKLRKQGLHIRVQQKYIYHFPVSNDFQ